MKILTLVVFCATASLISAPESVAQADSGKLTFYAPTALNMRTALARDNYVVLEGSLTFSARYEFIYEQGTEGEVPTLHLYPDNLINMPKFFSNGAPVKDMIISIKNFKAAGRMLFGKPRTDSLIAGDYSLLQGKAVFVIDGLVASYQCNKPHFSSVLTRIDNILEEVSKGEAKKRPGC